MISVTILTKNSSQTLKKTLESLTGFSEVLVLDTGSTDNTIQIAKEFRNVRIEESDFIGFGPTHNLATQLATHDWILSIDSDEVLSKELQEEILQTKLDKTCVYKFSRHNYFYGKWIKCCSGWYPDPIIRLYNRKETAFSQDAVHEKVLIKDLKIVPFKGPLYHTPYRSISDFLKKMESYTTLFAEQNAGKKKSSFFTAIFHAYATFIKSYIIKRGFLGGKEGYIISSYNAQTAFYKYLKLMEKNEELKNRNNPFA